MLFLKRCQHVAAVLSSLTRRCCVVAAASVSPPPCRHVREISVMDTAMQVLPTLLLLGATWWLISRQMKQMTGGMGGMGGFGGFGQKGGKGAKGGQSGFFGMGRATTGSLDKKADKIMFK